MIIDLAQALQDWGYPLVFLGTFLEGETILLLAGMAAYKGYLDFTAVVLIALIASFLGDQLYFLLGRRYGALIIRRWPALRPRLARFTQLLQRHHTPLILSIRFLYGLRIVGPMALGLTEISWARYTLLNLIGGVIWAMLVTSAGYLFGNALDWVLTSLYRFELLGMLILGGIGITLWIRTLR